jgi:cytoskeletal protein CcmA (bactofilin family)
MLGKSSGGSGESKLNSLIGNGSNCAGDIVVEGGLKIDGYFKGTIKAHSIYVGKNANIEATVVVKTAVIGGKVLGDVIAEDGLELQPKAELIGDVRTKNLVVADTAVLEGRFDMGKSKAYASRPKLDIELGGDAVSKPEVGEVPEQKKEDKP